MIEDIAPNARNVNRVRLLQALLRNDFRAVVHRTFVTLAPGQRFVPNWHLEAIAYGLCSRVVKSIKEL